MIFLGLGSNIGNRKQNLMRAIELLNQHNDIIVRKISSIYETEPYGVKEQDDFLNAVIVVETKLFPEELLDVCLTIESRMGRTRELRWGPRVIDIDLLSYNNEAMHTERLTLPHPFFALRKFVLVPMAEIAGDFIVSDGMTVKNLLMQCPDSSNVTLYFG
ncbi:2-amino-4-hydroxy-6-hydroxymethyldihydropteridine diphosphokinase [Anaerosinus sp.]